MANFFKKNIQTRDTFNTLTLLHSSQNLYLDALG